VLDPAVIEFDETGRITAANERALTLLGVSLDELRAAPPGAFSARPTSAEDQAAFREVWESAGRPGIGGEAMMRRADGQELRIRHVITTVPTGGFAASFEPISGTSDEPDVVYALDDVLREWRALERQLEVVDAETEEAGVLRTEIERLRGLYHSGFAAKRRTAT
jgi:PAS domain-containing protein